MKKKRKSKKQMSRLEFVGRWFAAWTLGLLIMAYCILVGCPTLVLILVLEMTTKGFEKLTGWVTRLNLKLANFATRAYDFATKVHPKGGDEK